MSNSTQGLLLLFNNDKKLRSRTAVHLLYIKKMDNEEDNVDYQEDGEERSRSRSRSRDNENSNDNNDKNDNLFSLHVSQLNFATTEQSLKAYFSNYGEVTSVSVLREPMTLCSRGFGFVSFNNNDPIEKVLAESHLECDGRRISVERAKRRAGYDKTPGRYEGKRAFSSRGGRGGHDRYDNYNSRGNGYDRYRSDDRNDRYDPRGGDYRPGASRGDSYSSSRNQPVDNYDRYDDRRRPPPSSYDDRGRPTPSSYDDRGRPPPSSSTTRGDYYPSSRNQPVDIYDRYDDRGRPPPPSSYGDRGRPSAPSSYDDRGRPPPPSQYSSSRGKY